MKTIYIKSAIAAMALCAIACNGDEEFNQFQSPVENTTVSSTVDETSVSRLTFAWPAVSGVTQYGYELTDNNGDVVRSGLTQDTTASFDKLNAGTTYSLTVEALGKNGVTTKSFTLTGTTAAITQLAAPTASSMDAVNTNGQMLITWAQVEKADYYSYTVYDEDDELVVEGTCEENKLWLRGLDIGEYMVYVAANSNDEHYSISEYSSVMADRYRRQSSSTTGVFTSGTSGTYDVTIDLYNDGSYIVRSFVGIEDFDLEFGIGEDGVSVVILNGTDDSGWTSIDFNKTWCECGCGCDNKSGSVCGCSVCGQEQSAKYSVYEDADYCYYYEDETGKNIYMWANLDDGTSAFDHLQWDIP